MDIDSPVESCVTATKSGKNTNYVLDQTNVRLWLLPRSKRGACYSHLWDNEHVMLLQFSTDKRLKPK